MHLNSLFSYPHIKDGRNHTDLPVLMKIHYLTSAHKQNAVERLSQPVLLIITEAEGE